MTTLVALSTKDALVMGCDSLGTVTAPLIDPFQLFDYFDKDSGNKLKVDENGKPLLKNYKQILDKSELVPYSHMTHVSKLFSLSPLPMGVMATGIVSIGKRTIKSLIGEFKAIDPAFSKTIKPTNYTVKSIGTRLLNFIWSHYLKEYPEGQYKPELELIIGGYDLKSQVPAIYRIYINENNIKPVIANTNFGVVFGGQMKEIQRIVFGTDSENLIKISKRSRDLLDIYYKLVYNEIIKQKPDAIVKTPTEFGDKLSFFDDDKWKLNEFDANWGDFSEQNAIELVDFFVNVMVKSQQFTARLPTVGGEVHIAVICKLQGFRYVSGEQWKHGGHEITVTED